MAEKWHALSGPFTAGSRQALNGSEMARLKGAIYGWLMASLKWQKNDYTETGHLRQEMASHAAISAICCLNWNHKWAIYVMFAGMLHILHTIPRITSRRLVSYF